MSMQLRRAALQPIPNSVPGAAGSHMSYGDTNTAKALFDASRNRSFGLTRRRLTAVLSSFHQTVASWRNSSVGLGRLRLVVLAQLFSLRELRREHVVDCVQRAPAPLDVRREILPPNDVDLGRRPANLVLNGRLRNLRPPRKVVRIRRCRKFGHSVPVDVEDLPALQGAPTEPGRLLETLDPCLAGFLREGAFELEEDNLLVRLPAARARSAAARCRRPWQRRRRRRRPARGRLPVRQAAHRFGELADLLLHVEAVLRVGFVHAPDLTSKLLLLLRERRLPLLNRPKQPRQAGLQHSRQLALKFALEVGLEGLQNVL